LTTDFQLQKRNSIATMQANGKGLAKQLQTD
jgi:hypothetical protein